MHIDSLIQSLNTQQKMAVAQDTGILLVIAGAGSGKTRVITSRITRLLIERNAPASSIIALTFTNKAANEMKERIQHFLADVPGASLPFIGTFHAYCLRILKANAHLLPNPFVSILDEDDQHKLLNMIITRHNLNKQTTAKQLTYHISGMKNNTDNMLYQEWLSKNPLFASVYQAYEQQKRASKCLDFDDLLLETVALFQTNPLFKQEFQNSVRHILVDEYQDTNTVQHELLKQMTLADKEFVSDSLCVVGDEDQSIYSWRGATVANIVNFKQDFPAAHLIKIEQNYRSAQPILEAANQIIVHNKNRHPKTLWSTKPGSDRIRSLMCLSDYHEADMVAQMIKVIKLDKKDFSIALLYRTHFQSRSLEEALIKQGIAYKIIGGVQFYERKEIKDLLAYLRVMVNPFDRASFFRIINCPSRGLGQKFEELFDEQWRLQPFLDFMHIAQQLIDQKLIVGTKKDALIQFVQIFKQYTNLDQPLAALEYIIQQTNYRMHIKESYDPEEAASRLENVKELLRAVHHFQHEKNITTLTLLHEIALMQSQYDQTKEGVVPVLLMTLHAAKGLEFDVVILSGLEDGLLPSSRSLHDEDAIEEERRLLYVGITRAKEYLLMSHSRFRYTFGSMSDQKPSRFLKEISPQLLKMHDCAHWNPSQIKSFIYGWFTLSNTTAPDKKDDSVTPNKIIASGKISSSWKKNQPVQHEVFGTGIIKDIETKAETTYLTISFKTGIKKIASSFVTIL